MVRSFFRWGDSKWGYISLIFVYQKIRKAEEVLVGVYSCNSELRTSLGTDMVGAGEI